jgi:hypothetical protein
VASYSPDVGDQKPFFSGTYFRSTPVTGTVAAGLLHAVTAQWETGGLSCSRPENSLPGPQQAQDGGGGKSFSKDWFREAKNSGAKL